MYSYTPHPLMCECANSGRHISEALRRNPASWTYGGFLVAGRGAHDADLAGAAAVIARLSASRVAASVVLLAFVIVGAGVPVSEAVVAGSPAPGAC